jgi:CRP-like cAMP-binding protein
MPAGVDADAQRKLLSRFGRQLHGGDVVFREGEPAIEAFLLQQGRVRLSKRLGAVERSLRIVRPGQLFGETALIPGASRTTGAVALEDGVALALDRETFQQVMAANPNVAARVIEEIVRRLRDAEEQVEILMVEDGRAKVLRALTKLAEHAVQERGGAGQVIELDVSPMELAARVALDVDLVRRTVQQLRDAEYIRIDNEKVVIIDLQSFVELEKLLALKGQIGSRDVVGAAMPRKTETR